MGKMLAWNKLYDTAMKKVLYFFTICICMVSCADFSSKVERYVSEKHAETDTMSFYEIDLQDVLDKRISEVYVFGEVTSNEEISEIIGIELPHRKTTMSWDTKYHIVCVYDKLVTYEELYTKKNVSIDGNDTTWYFSKKCQDIYSQFHPGMTPPAWCQYKVFHSPKMRVNIEPLNKNERKEYWHKRYWYELSAVK